MDVLTLEDGLLVRDGLLRDGLLVGDSGTGLFEVGDSGTGLFEVGDGLLAGGGVSFGDVSSNTDKDGASVRSLVVSGICDGLVTL